MLRAVRDVIACGGCGAVIVALTLESPTDIYRIAALAEMMMAAIKMQTLILCDSCTAKQVEQPDA